MNFAVTNTVMRHSDEMTIRGGVDSKELMLRAGKGIFSSCADWKKTLVVCGTGNNGGDGYVLALLLKENGNDVHILLTEERFSPDGLYYFEKCKEKGIPYSVFSDEFDLDSYDTVADCIFGTGFHGEVTGSAKKCIEAINKSSAFVVSADINSGLSGDSGKGDICVISDLTVAVQFFKTGHFFGRAKDVMKQKVCVDIGIDLYGEKIYITDEKDIYDILKARKNDCHKGDFGYTAIIGGSREYSGAAKLANLSLSALRMGCGVTKLCVAESLYPSVSPYIVESTLFLMPDDRGEMLFDKEKLDALLKGTKCVSVGMGWGRGRDNGRILSYIIKNYTGTLIIDADGINTLSVLDKNILSESSCKKIILTPHPLEFSRISGYDAAQIINDPVSCAASYLEDKMGKVILLLKGTATLVAGNERMYIVDRGSAGMATAGSGDVLSGILTGILGYNEPTELAVACGAYVSGLAGELAQEDMGDICMTSTDTVKYIPFAVKIIRQGFEDN